MNQLLIAARKQKGWSQARLAAELQTALSTIKRWESGERLPYPIHREKLCILFNKSEAELGFDFDFDSSGGSEQRYWHIPFLRNSFFTGRESVLQQLHEILAQEGAATLSQTFTLSGLGGIGKTQTAIEYAYRYANDYAAIFWINAETHESILASFVAIAELLNLPEKQEKDQSRIVAAVTRWFTNHLDWLVIFDNVEDLDVVKGVLPPARSGSLLFTSRHRAWGFEAQTFQVEKMTSEEGLYFLLYRARMLKSSTSLNSLAPEDIRVAREIVETMDGLPLALDQAGAYIETTQCSLSDYWQLFQSSQLRLLDERDTHADHPSSVTRTFTLAFAHLERINPAAAELLTVCAFLASEAIPETFFIEGATQLGPTFEKLAADPFAFQATLKALLAYSLIQRNAATKMLTIHRLVQAVLLDMTGPKHALWLQRILMSLDAVFPEILPTTKADVLKKGERLLPHALLCLVRAKDATESLTFASIGYKVAQYLRECGQYRDAESFFLRVLTIQEHLDSNPLDIARTLNYLAVLYWTLGKYEQAEPLYQRALHIREQIWGSEHTEVARTLNNLALVYWNLGKYEQAEPLYRRALYIQEHMEEKDLAGYARTLNNLAALFREQNKDEQAEPLYQRALQISEQSLGLNHPQVAQSLDNLAIVYWNLGKHEEAKKFNQRALHIVEEVQGPDHPDAARSLTNMADFNRYQGKYEQAEPLYQRALRLWEQALGDSHPLLAEPLNGLAQIYHDQGKLHKALPFAERGLKISEQALGEKHPKTKEWRAFYAQLLQEKQGTMD